ncbi:MAG: hypothetical protein WCQ64_02120 [Acidobacteriota bacterium]
MTSLDCTRILVIGEGLAAGMTNFSLIEADQVHSFPAQLARQLKTRFVQPLLQAPGLGDAPGFARLPVRLPFDAQTTVLSQFPVTESHANVSFPGLTLADVLTRRASQPLVRGDDALQTAINLIVGMDGALTSATMATPTALEYALSQKPTLAIIELGFAEALDAAVSRRPDAVPDAATFRAHYTTLVSALRATGCHVIVTTIPDPSDTAHFSPVEAVARVLKVPAPMVAMVSGLQPGDLVSVEGLMELGYQFICKAPQPIADAAILRAGVATAISARIDALNAEITAIAKQCGAVTYDLRALYRAVRTSGIAVGTRTLTADFLGGFYSLNGYYPGATGQALIANGLIDTINAAFGATFDAIRTDALLATDAVANYRLADGPDFTPADLTPPPAAPVVAAAAVVAKAAGKSKKSANGPATVAGALPLTLPAGLEQVLPLDNASSYYGDALRAVHTSDPAEIGYGITGNLLFGGLALLDSHLSGHIKITFTEPVNHVTHFTVTHGDGLVGDDGKLSAPQFFKLPGLMNKLLDPQDVLSSGDLDLTTGAVSNLQYRLFFQNSAIFALAQVNPNLPKEPINFPGQYGSTWAQFVQRSDGLLDFECYCTTFIPMSVLGAPARFPLPFVSPTMSFASIPCDGTALHPHLHLSTMAPEPVDVAQAVPEFPTNTVQVFTAPTFGNYFGDDFSLNAPEIGGRGTGRSHLVGRYQIQFGEQSGNAVSFAVQSLMPGGLLRTLPQTPIAGAFGKRVPDSLIGHDEWLRFKHQMYNNSGISWLDDPLDIAVGSVDVTTGKVLGHFLRRGMITTSWILAMLQLEPRTPKSTFAFRGPASFVKGVNGETVFRYHGDLHIPFPEGFAFPAADLTTPITIGPNSALDPFLRFQGVHVPRATARSGNDQSWVEKRGGSYHMTASNRADFKYRYVLGADPATSSFEFTDITDGGTFTMTRLIWVDFLNSQESTAAPGDYDTFTFTGFGTWSQDADNGVHTATVHIAQTPGRPYISVLIDGGATRNLNTRPPNRDVTVP